MDDHASRTARAVAVGRAVGIDGIRDPLVEHLLPRRDRVTVRALRALPAGRPALGMTAHAALRMRAVDDALEAALATTNADTVVVVGAGWDTRAWRLDSLTGRRVLEVDHPATQRAKRARLADLPSPLAEVDFVGADLRTADLDDVLATAGQDPEVPVVWIWEAVVPYLPPDAVDATLHVLAARSAPGSRLLVTTMTPGLVEPWLPAMSAGAFASLRLVGEPILTARSDPDIVDWLATHGWRSGGGRGPRSWADAAGVTLFGPTLDERLHVAERQDVTG